MNECHSTFHRFLPRPPPEMNEWNERGGLSLVVFCLLVISIPS